MGSARELVCRRRKGIFQSASVKVDKSGAAVPLTWFDGLTNITVTASQPLTCLDLRMGDLTILSRAEASETEKEPHFQYRFRSDFRGYSICLPRILNTSYFELRGLLQCHYEPRNVPIIFSCQTVTVPGDLYRTLVDHYLVNIQFAADGTLWE